MRKPVWMWRGLMALAALFGLPAWAEPAASIVSLQGKGQVRSAEAAPWFEARVKQTLSIGEYVRTGEYSRMGLLFQDRTQLRLNEKTLLRVVDARDRTRLRLDLGRAWTQSKTPPDTLYMETPAATAAIRGTDWDIEVAEDGRTTITVLSGEVAFYNDFGRIVLGRDESGEARVGRAPTRLMLARPKDRVQWVSAYAVDPLRRITLAARPTGDLLGEGFAALRRGDVDAARRAFDAVDVATAREAERLALGRVALNLLADDFGRAYAGLAALTRAGEPGEPAPFLILADLAVYAGDLDKAADHLRAGLRVFSCDAALLGTLAGVHLLADRRDLSRSVLAEGHACAPGAPELALAEGELARIEGDAAGAVLAYETAIRQRPDDSRGWYGLGRVDTEREAIRAGGLHLRQALELNPTGPGYLGELGTLESLANRFEAARAAFAEALARNPDDYVALTGMGLLELKQGRTEAALDAFLRAGLMEPRYARVHLYTAIAYYQLGRVEQALYELRLAGQLDDKDPMPHFLASIVQTDILRPVDAVDSAREAMRLLPYLKSLNQLANNQQGLANLGQSFAYLGLEDWARHYAQESYFPFWAGSHLFLADHYQGLFGKNSELFQGFLADPTVFGGGHRAQTLVPKPGNHLSVSLATTSLGDAGRGNGAWGQVGGFANSQVPVAYFGDYYALDLDLAGGRHAQRDGNLALGIRPRHDLGVFLYADRRDEDVTLLNPEVLMVEREDRQSERADLGLHFKPAPDSQFWFKAGTFDSSDVGVGLFLLTPHAFKVEVRQPEWSLRHTFAAGDHEVTWGFESGHRRTAADNVSVDYLMGDPDATLFLGFDYDERSRDAFVSDRWRVDDRLALQADLHYQRHRRVSERTGQVIFPDYRLPLGKEGETYAHARVNPRFGLAYRFDSGPLLRLAYQRWQRPALFASLAPIATAGIPVDDRWVARGGELSRLRGQLEWEPSGVDFLSAYIDYKDIDNHRFGFVPYTLNELDKLARLRPRRLGLLASDDLLEFVDTPDWHGGRIHAAGLAYNRLLGGQWAGFARYAVAASENTGPLHPGKQAPYLPRHTVSLGAAWASPDGWYFIGRLVHRSTRYADEANLNRLDAGWDGAWDLFWQSRDKQWLYRVSVDNAFAPNRPTQYTAEVNLKF